MITANVTVALPLDNDDRQRLKEALESYAKSEIEIEEVLDPEVLGGLVVRIEDLLINDSLKYRLEKIRTCIIEGT